MPGLSGVDLQDRLIAMGYCIPIIFLTGHNETVRMSAYEAGSACLPEQALPMATVCSAILSRLRKRGYKADLRRVRSLAFSTNVVKTNRRIAEDRLPCSRVRLIRSDQFRYGHLASAIFFSSVQKASSSEMLVLCRPTMRECFDIDRALFRRPRWHSIKMSIVAPQLRLIRLIRAFVAPPLARRGLFGNRAAAPLEFLD